MIPLIVISGPTAVGKSACAMELALMVDGEVVSADSMQVYKYMNIGTAKPTPNEMMQVKHHLINVVDPDYNFNAAIYVDLAKKAVEDIHSRGKIPILTGGTGFYINALIYENNFENYQNNNYENSIRRELSDLLEKEGREYLFDLLLKLDPQYAKTTHVNNIKRVIRALEYFMQTGEKFSDYNKRSRANRKYAYDLNMFIISRERIELYMAIDKRVDKMIEMGLVQEVRDLIEMGYAPELPSMQGLGYKEIYAYIMGHYDFSLAVETLKQGTRRFAKRQITWFKNQTDGEWVDLSDFDNFKDIAYKIKLKSKI